MGASQPSSEAPYALRCSVNRPHLQEGKPAVIFVSIDISARGGRGVSPSALILALDVSGSMMGEKIDRAREAARRALWTLRPGDYLSLITFSDDVTTPIPLGQVSDFAAADGLIGGLKAGGATNLYGAIEAAMLEALKLPGVPKRILLLTDGQPTTGPGDLESFRRIASEVRARTGASVTCVGLGEDYNERILSTIALASGGSWYHVSQPDELVPIFQRETILAQTVVAAKPVLDLVLPSWAEIREAYAVEPTLAPIDLRPLPGGVYRVQLPDITPAQTQTLALKVAVSPMQAGKRNLLSASLISGDRVLQRGSVDVEFTGDPAKYSLEVDPRPRALFFASQSTIMVRRGLETRDFGSVSRGRALFASLLSDPEATRLMRTDAWLRDAATTVMGLDADAVARGRLSEEERKELIFRTTIIRREEKGSD